MKVKEYFNIFFIKKNPVISASADHVVPDTSSNVRSRRYNVIFFSPPADAPVVAVSAVVKLAHVFFFSSLCSFCADSEKDDVEPGNGIAQWRLNEQLFPCPVCGKVFGRQQTLSRHLALHTGKYTQGVCMAGFMGVIVDVCVYMFNSCSH